MITSKAKINGFFLHSADPFRAVPFEKNPKILKLAFEANNAASLSCTFFRTLAYCATTPLQNSPPQLAMSKYYASDSRDNIVAVDVATTSFCTVL